jgi:hypothetical protein
MAMLRWEPFREMENALRRFSPLYMPDNGTTGADADDPPSRVARVAFIEGSVSFQPACAQDWVAAPLNRPLTTGNPRTGQLI